MRRRESDRGNVRYFRCETVGIGGNPGVDEVRQEPGLVPRPVCLDFRPRASHPDKVNITSQSLKPTSEGQHAAGQPRHLTRNSHCDSTTLEERHRFRLRSGRSDHLYRSGHQPIRMDLVHCANPFAIYRSGIYCTNCLSHASSPHPPTQSLSESFEGSASSASSEAPVLRSASSISPTEAVNCSSLLAIRSLPRVPIAGEGAERTAVAKSAVKDYGETREVK